MSRPPPTVELLPVQGDREGAGCFVQALPVERVVLDVGAQVALSGRGDVAGDAAPLGLRRDHLADPLGGDAPTHDQLQSIRFAIEEPDLEVVEAEQIVDVVDDLVRQKLETLHCVAVTPGA